MSEEILLDFEDDTVTLTLNRPDRMNALSDDMALEICNGLEQVKERKARCLVIEGAGRAFSAGGDIYEMREKGEKEIATDERIKSVMQTNEIVKHIVKFPIPTIAKVDGPALGAGASLAIACDISLASESSVFGFLFRRVGLCVDTGISYLLPQIVGRNVAKELVFTGKIIEADCAAELGLLNHVFSDEKFDEKSNELIAEISNGPTLALKYSKLLIDEAPDKSLDNALKDEAIHQGLLYDTDDHKEGVRAFFEDRDPEFEGK